ncbi:MAG: signal peptidase I [Coriobacteriaceae bacterium]|nr:signal peptidase I [Coriobacteriaceae bacterium]
MVLLAVFLGFSYFLRVSVLQSYVIPSGSMEETIMIGDRVWAEKLSYQFRDIEPGDIVTFEDPEIPGRILVKRCVAVAGQTVDMRNGILYVDGAPRVEPYTGNEPSAPIGRTAVDIAYPYLVPEGTIWLMGDHRTNSQDSRYFGPVDTSTVFGRAFMIYWPLDHLHVFD